MAHFKLLQQAANDKLFPDFMIERQQKMSEIHGRVVSTFLTKAALNDFIFTSDPRNIQAILATQFSDFGLGGIRFKAMVGTLGDGIFLQDGKKWEHSRAMLRPNFVRDRVSDLDLEEHHVQNLLRVVPLLADGWTAEIDIQTLFFRLTIDSATEFLFGKSVDSQLTEAGFAVGGTSEQSSRERAFSPAFDSAQVHLTHRARLGGLYWLHNPKNFRENNRVIDEFIEHYIQLALSKTQKQPGQSIDDKGHYVFLDELAQRTRDPAELRAQLLNVLLAGRDTTASLLSWLFHELLRNPEIFAKLRATIIETFGTFEQPKDISFPNLKGCQYLQHCLNEALRLWPVVPVNARRALKLTTLPKGGGPDGESPILVPEGMRINYSVHTMHRRKDLWGPDADVFRPERFQNCRPSWEFLPFNGGPRICIGQQFALTEASYVVVRLLQRFDQIVPGQHELEGRVRSQLGLTNCPAKLVTLRLHAAS